MYYELPPLPYAIDALAPHISARTLEFHYGKHHQAYLTNLNNLADNTKYENASLEEVITATANNEAEIAIFNNAAQAWNHAFFWKSMKPGGGGDPDSALAIRLEQSFGSLTKFREQFRQAGVAQFGSGWVWLVWDGNALRIVKTSNAHNPLVDGLTPLLTCDVWEHAYYLDYQNRRADFIQALLDHLVNWDFAAINLSDAG